MKSLLKGFRENRILKALYSYTDPETGEVLALCGTHVDDLIWAAKPKAEEAIKKVYDTFDESLRRGST